MPSEQNWVNAEALSGVGGEILSTKVIIPELTIHGVKVFHPLIVMEGAPFPLIVGMDILVLHKMSLASPSVTGLTLQQAPECYACQLNKKMEEKYLPPQVRSTPETSTRRVQSPIREEYESDRGEEQSESPTLCCCLDAGFATRATLNASDFREGEPLLIEDADSDEPDFNKGILPTVACVRNGRVDVMVFNGDEKEKYYLSALRPKFVSLREDDFIGAVGPAKESDPTDRICNIINTVCKDTTCLSANELAQFGTVVRDNMSVFAEHDMDLGKTTRILHEI